MRNVNKIFVEKCEWENQLGGLGVHGEIVVKQMLNK
jgi:hypothetical protein